MEHNRAPRHTDKRANAEIIAKWRNLVAAAHAGHLSEAATAFVQQQVTR